MLVRGAPCSVFFDVKIVVTEVTLKESCVVLEVVQKQFLAEQLQLY